jgi:hypothetical protein
MEQPPFEPDTVAYIGARLPPGVTTMSTNADRIEVFAGIQRRRRHTAEQKMAFVQEAMQPGMTISYVARRQSRDLGPAEASSGARASARQEDDGERDLARGGEVGARKKLISRLPSLPDEDSL